jgi:hypothetical protein
MTNGVFSLKETINRLAAIKKELATTKRLKRHSSKKGKRVKPNTQPN